MKIKSFTYITIFVILVLLLLFGLFLFINNALKMREGSREGSDYAMVLPEFSLIDNHERVVTKASLMAKYTVVLFGFSKCPSICPTQLGDLTRFLHSVDNEAAFENLQVYFITLDPENDTPSVLSEYSKNFHPKIQMLTGEKQVIDNLLKHYKVYVEHDKEGNINHSSILYFLGKRGEFLSSLDLSNEQVFYHDIKKMMK